MRYQTAEQLKDNPELIVGLSPTATGTMIVYAHTPDGKRHGNVALLDERGAIVRLPGVDPELGLQLDERRRVVDATEELSQHDERTQARETALTVCRMLAGDGSVEEAVLLAERAVKMAGGG